MFGKMQLIFAGVIMAAVLSTGWMIHHRLNTQKALIQQLTTDLREARESLAAKEAEVTALKHDAAIRSGVSAEHQDRTGDVNQSFDGILGDLWRDNAGCDCSAIAPYPRLELQMQPEPAALTVNPTAGDVPVLRFSPAPTPPAPAADKRILDAVWRAYCISTVDTPPGCVGTLP